MSSREVRDLNQGTQVQLNKFLDRCRRDTELLKKGITVLLTCTYRSDVERDKLGDNGKSKIRDTPSGAFEATCLLHGRVHFLVFEVIEHAKSVGLEYDGKEFHGNA